MTLRSKVTYVLYGDDVKRVRGLRRTKVLAKKACENGERLRVVKQVETIEVHASITLYRQGPSAYDGLGLPYWCRHINGIELQEYQPRHGALSRIHMSRARRWG